MGPFVKEVLRKSFCCVNSTLHAQASLWAQGREYPFSREQGMTHPSTSLGPTAGPIWTSRSSPGDQIAAGWASPLSSARLGQVQILPSLGTAACPPPSPANLILSGLYFRSDKKDLEGSTYHLRPRLQDSTPRQEGDPCSWCFSLAPGFKRHRDDENYSQGFSTSGVHHPE